MIWIAMMTTSGVKSSIPTAGITRLNGTKTGSVNWWSNPTIGAARLEELIGKNDAMARATITNV